MIASHIVGRNPDSVYKPIRYVMSSGGKRLRAVLTVLACEAVGGKPHHAFHAGAAIELLHNFTLVHDDVMDHAPLRRNRKTVHERWDTNTAILIGDEMVALAYAALLKSASGNLEDIVRTFTRAFIEVCEGQGFDKEFELRDNVTVDEYSLMISKKTARVISAAAEIGAHIGKGTDIHRNALRSFGEHIGMAFQMKDDLLDILGNPREFGKTVGGDIAEGKKTFLLLRAIARSRGNEKKFLRSLRPGLKISRTAVNRVRHLYESTGAIDDARHEMIRMTTKAKKCLSVLPGNRGTTMLSWLADELLERTN